MTLESAINYFFAAGIGAIVARKPFVAHALSLAVLIWIVTTFILYDIAQPAGTVAYMQTVMDQLTGLILLAVAATLGALLGGWCYRHEIASSATARDPNR